MWLYLFVRPYLLKIQIHWVESLQLVKNLQKLVDVFVLNLPKTVFGFAAAVNVCIWIWIWDLLHLEASNLVRSLNRLIRSSFEKPWPVSLLNRFAVEGVRNRCIGQTASRCGTWWQLLWRYFDRGWKPTQHVGWLSSRAEKSSPCIQYSQQQTRDQSPVSQKGFRSV